MNYFQYVVIAVGIFCVIRGFMTLASGKISAKEEAEIATFSDNGKKKYKLFNAIYNIVGGLVCVAVGVIRILNVVNADWFRLVVAVLLILMVISYYVVRNICKKMA